ncbi:PQQ-binding-like beta-propeller repeat protein [Nonomuraea sp. B12E4]|uniref:protein kinase domain-containing protein n=1 Tax=Nonomuraea sp. B12E4 TaxID=3153564 RepID=UPI00325F2D92
MQPLQHDDPPEIGPYRLLGRLGAGGMGVVYLGRSPGGRLVAVKVVRRRFVGDPRYRARFEREVRAARDVNGTFTAPVLDADPGAPAPWLATAYLPGLSLREAIEAHGRMPPESVRALAAGLAEALVAIHRAGVVHRDLKPENVMLTSGGPRVIDFGVARPHDAATLTRAGRPIGTPGFMAPEQIMAGQAGPPCDLFALGAVLAYAATGAEPFGSGAPQSRLYRALRAEADLGEVPAGWLRELIASCLRREPEERGTAADVLARVAAAGEDELSLQGTTWLPAEVAEEIDRRAGRTFEPPEPPGEEAKAVDGRVGEAVGGAAGGRVGGPVDALPTCDPDLASGELPAGDAATSEGALSRGPSRRTLLAGAAAGLLAAAGAGALAWERNASGAERSPSPPPTRPASAAAPTERRTTPPPEATSRWRARVPGSVQLAAAGGVLMAGGSEEVRAIHPRTRKVLWKRRITRYYASGDMVYTIGRPDNWRVCAIRAASGKIRWTYDDIRPGGITMWHAVTGPVVCNGDERGILALDLDDGRRRWVSKADAKYELIADAGVVVAVSSDELVAVDARSGRKRWTYPIDYGTNPLMAEGLVLAYDRFGTVHAIRADDGERVWQRQDVKGYGAQAGGDRLYTETNVGEVLALELATGNTIWRRRLGDFENDPRAQATAMELSGGTLHVSCVDGILYALDAADGHIRWTYGGDSQQHTPPVTLDGAVFFSTMDEHVRAVDPPV